MEEINILQAIKANYPYIFPFLMVIVGFYIILIEKNLIKKVIGLNILQGGIILFYILISKIFGALPPIYTNDEEILANPLPHVLMLTAIVVGIATTAVAFALIYNIYKNYGTINEEELININHNKNI